MFIDQVLFALAIQNNCVIVKPFDNPAKLKSIGQVDRHRNMIFSRLIEKNVLQIEIFHRLFPPRALRIKLPTSIKRTDFRVVFPLSKPAQAI
jgi:hypothetical protein